MRKVLIDEFPLDTNCLLSNDYNGKIINRLLGKPFIEIEDKKIINSQLEIVIKENSIEIIANNEEEKIILDEIKSKIDQIYKAWKGCYKVFFLGIERTTINGKESLYTMYDNKIVIKFKSSEKIYPFICLLASHYFNCRIPGSTEYIKCSDNRIEIKTDKYTDLIQFLKVKNGSLNMFLYSIGLVDITSNTNFPNRIRKIWQNKKDYTSVKSGIECVIISTNKDSVFFNNKHLRKYIFSLISDSEIHKKLYCNIDKSAMSTIYKEEKYNEEKISLSISYDDYYPNRIIVEQIRRQLKARNIDLKIIKSDYFKPKEDADCRLYLFSNEFKDEIFKYYFLGLISSLNREKTEYLKFLCIVNEYFRGEISSEECIRRLKYILIENGIYFSIGEIKSTFLSRNHQLDFIYYE